MKPRWLPVSLLPVATVADLTDPNKKGGCKTLCFAAPFFLLLLIMSAKSDKSAALNTEGLSVIP